MDANADAMDQQLAKYLLHPDMYNVVIRVFHPKLVQRSYGKEKRFFSPAPYLSFGGIGWKMMSDEIYRDYCASGKISPSPIMYQNNVLSDMFPVAWSCELGVADTVVTSRLEFGAIVPWIFHHFSGNGLHVNNIACGKYFKLSANFTVKRCSAKPEVLYNFGKVESSPIHVVSKPPKRQLAKCTDSGFVCLKSGMKVAVFQRAKPQIPAIEYMHVSGEQMVCSKGEWSCFYIYTVANNEVDNNYGFKAEYNVIKYGNRVRLVECLTGISTPSFIIRKVDGGKVITDMSLPEHVLQLNRVAFEIDPNIYWSICESQLVQRELNSLGNGVNLEAPDNVVWTTVEVDYTEYKFSLLKGLPQNPIAPIPIIHDAVIQGSSEALSIVELHGLGLSEDLGVYFGLVPVNIISTNVNTIRLQIPHLSFVLSAPYNNNMTTFFADDMSKVKVPISLVRRDGLVVPTDVTFTYNCSSFGGIGELHFATLHEQQQVEFEKRITEDDDDEHFLS